MWLEISRKSRSGYTGDIESRLTKMMKISGELHNGTISVKSEGKFFGLVVGTYLHQMQVKNKSGWSMFEVK